MKLGQRGPRGGVVLALPQMAKPLPECTCGAHAQFKPTSLTTSGRTWYTSSVHVAGCEVLGFNRLNIDLLEEKPKGVKILLTTGQPWQPPKPPKCPTKGHSREARQGPTNYKLVLQFYFNRPINIDLWKKIKAPPGWRKGPTSRDSQTKYYGVRFLCKDLKYNLTPEEVETLRAKLYLALELDF